MSKISTNTEVNIDEVEQKTLPTICTTKLHRCYRVTVYFLDLHQNFSPKFHPPLLIPLLLPSREYCVVYNAVSPSYWPSDRQKHSYVKTSWLYATLQLSVTLNS